MTCAIYDNAHRHKSRSNASLLSIDYIARMHTEMKKSPRGEKESWKEIRRETERGKKNKKENEKIKNKNN